MGRVPRGRVDTGRVPGAEPARLEHGAAIPELARDDVRGVFDGELVAFQDGVPHFPLVGARMLHRKRDVPVAYAVFDVLALDGEPTMNLPYVGRV